MVFKEYKAYRDDLNVKLNDCWPNKFKEKDSLSFFLTSHRNGEKPVLKQTYGNKVLSSKLAPTASAWSF